MFISTLWDYETYFNLYRRREKLKSFVQELKA